MTAVICERCEHPTADPHWEWDDDQGRDVTVCWVCCHTCAAGEDHEP